MFVPEHEWIYAPHLVFDARRVLASVRAFSERVHANAYSIPSIALELGVRVEYLADVSYGMLGMCTRRGDGVVITLNDAIENTTYDMAGLVHELGHAVVEEVALGCKGRLHRSVERDAWLRGIYVAISRALADDIGDGHSTVREIAARCFVPDPIVRIRLDLAVALGERAGDVEQAYETIRAQLLVLEQWFDEGRKRGFREWALVY